MNFFSLSYHSQGNYTHGCTQGREPVSCPLAQSTAHKHTHSARYRRLHQGKGTGVFPQVKGIRPGIFKPTTPCAKHIPKQVAIPAGTGGCLLYFPLVSQPEGCKGQKDLLHHPSLIAWPPNVTQRVLPGAFDHLQEKPAPLQSLHKATPSYVLSSAHGPL